MDHCERGESKKLVDAGGAWYALGNQPPRPERAAVDENVLEGMRSTGATDEQIAEVVASWDAPDADPVDDEDFEVYADNWESVMFFFGLETQWTYATPGMGAPRLVGLPSSQIEAEMNMRGIARKQRLGLLSDLRLCERGALRAQHKALQEAAP